MKRHDFEQLILNELKELRSDMKEVRETDVPKINTAVAGFRTEIDTLKSSQMWSTRLYTVIGGAIAVVIAKFTGGQH